MTAEAIASSQNKPGIGLRILSIINVGISLFVGLITFLLGMMAGSGNENFEAAFGLTILAGAASVIASIIGFVKTWRGTGSLTTILLLQFSWIFALIIFVIAISATPGRN